MSAVYTSKTNACLTSAIRLDMCPALNQLIKTRIKQGNKSKEIQYILISLPLYLVECLPNIVKAI